MTKIFILLVVAWMSTGDVQVETTSYKNRESCEIIEYRVNLLNLEGTGIEKLHTECMLKEVKNPE
jgi:hypothetical protein